MKRAILLLVFFLLLAAFAVGQEQPKSYVKSVSILKVLAHNLGYKVLYLKSSLDVGEFYIPYDWFKAAGKAEVVFGGHPSYPYFSVFYKDGAFSFIRLYLKENIKDISWGRLPAQEGDSAKFDVDDLVLDF